MATAAAPAQQAIDIDSCSVERSVRSANPSYLRPLQFFPAWQGVLTLAFSGYPPSLKALKQDINEHLNGIIPKESPGSMWPKVTLGALKDNVRLTPEMLACVNKVCREVSSMFFSAPSNTSQALLVDSLDVVVYSCRSLERQVSRHRIPLMGSANQSGTSIDDSHPSEEECFRVKAIVGEAESPEYWFFASKDGNRETHYKGNALGVSLVAHLNQPTQQQQQQSQGSGGTQSELQRAIAMLRQRIEQELPGCYTWMGDPSLHCTLRALL